MNYLNQLEMKILLTTSIMLLTFGLVTAQNNNTNVEINGNKSTISELAEQRNKQGVTYQGKGVYKIVEVGNTFKVSLKRMERDAREKADDLVKNMGGAQYADISLDKVGAAYGSYAQVRLTIVVQDYMQQPVLKRGEDKENAIEKIKELNSLKEQGIISEEEYNKATAPYKAIILK